jgi:hypothetical protein
VLVRKSNAKVTRIGEIKLTEIAIVIDVEKLNWQKKSFLTEAFVVLINAVLL